MFLSIIIPVWNDEKYLNECLDSCLDQDLSKDDYEIICVDDGSTDRTPEMLKAYAERYSNIRIITKQHGAQFGNGRVIGLEASKADYVWFVDHDDIVAPRAVDDLKKGAEANPEHNRIVFPYYMFFDELTPVEKEMFHQGSLVANDKGYLKDMVVWASIFLRSFLLENEIYPRSTRIQKAKDYWKIEPFMTWSGDTIFVEECLDKGIQTAELEGRPLYFYRRHNDSETMDTSKEAIQQRNIRRRNYVLLWGYLIHQLELQYKNEKDTLGAATTETTQKLIDMLRRCSAYMINFPHKQWKSVIRLFSSRNLFLKDKPEEYRFSFEEYRNNLWKKEKYTPHLLVFYFTYTKVGAILYRFFSCPYRMKQQSAYFAGKKRKKRQTYLIETGTGRTEKQ